MAVVAATLLVAAQPASSTTTAAANRVQAAIAAGDVNVVRDASGRVRYVSTPEGRPLAAPRGAQTANPETAARSYLAEFAPLFGVRNAADLKAAKAYGQGGVSVTRFQQTSNGLPVIGGELVVSTDKAGSLVAINGEATAAQVTAPATKVAPEAASQTARAVVAKAAGVSADLLTATQPQLSAYDPAMVGAIDQFGARAVWQLEVNGGKGRPDIDWYVLIDAATGRVALSFPQAAHADRSVCDYNNHLSVDYACPGAEGVDRGEGDPPASVSDVNNAYNLMGAFNSYLVSLGRNGIDDANLPLVASVRWCPNSAEDCPYGNAFWSGGLKQVVFGDDWATDDIVGHELTHGVTQHTSGLLYYYQSGAINESISDVLGELFDQSHSGPPSGDDSSGAKWLVGEDLPLGDGIALRDMADPPRGGQPDSMDSPEWFPVWQDFGGVHFNSGVGNKAAYLMRQGGTFKGVSVPAISSASSVAKIWLGADQLLTAGSDYADLAYALQQACSNLGLTSACNSVNKAVQAVKMTSPPTEEPAIPQAPTCTTGQSPVDIFADQFNRDELGAAWTEDGDVFMSNEAQPAGASGNAMLHATPWPDTGTATNVFTTDPIQLSDSATNYIRFHHLDGFDFVEDHPTLGTKYYDGGFVDIDVLDDEQGWIPLTTGWSNGPNKTIEGEPIEGFGGDSRGWTSSRNTLSDFSGKQVQFRFRQESDGFLPVSAGFGWFIDNVQVYTCAKADGLLTDYNGDGFGDVAVGEPLRDIAGISNAGAVHITYGSGTGLAAKGNQFLGRGTGGVPGAPGTDAQFGQSVVSGNFNGDAYGDIAVSAPGSSAGVINVLYGSQQGIQAGSARSFSFADIGSLACCNTAVALTAGDFNNDGYGDLAYGQTRASTGGGVGVLLGSSSGLRTTGKQFFTQGSPNVAGTGESGDQFGAAVSAGDFNNDGFSDLAVGAPGEDSGTPTDTGSVTILPGSLTGLTGTGSVQLTQSSAAVAGTSETGDQFGASLASGDINNDGFVDLAVGVPGEDVGALNSAGAVTALYGSATGITGTGSQALTQDSTAIPDTAEAEDRFGATVAIGDFNGDGFAEVAAGSPGEGLTAGAAAGTVTVIPGTGTGLTGTGALAWSQDSTGVLDSVQASDACGSSLLAARIRNAPQADLVFGCPGEDSSGQTNNGAIAVLDGSETGLTADGDQFFDGEGDLGGGGQSSARLGSSLG